MSGFGRSERGQSGPETVPPFWLPEDECVDQKIDERVLEVAKSNWSWAFWLTKKQLHDGARVGQIVEDAAIEVSNRLKADAEVGRNLNGYFRTTIIRTINTIAARENRIAYQGGSNDLEVNHHPQASDWRKIFENRMLLKALIPHMSYPVRQILHWRLADYSWKDIARRLSLSEKQAKSRFYYGAHQAYEELLRVQAMRARERDRNNGNEGSL
jgi:DNA-directed RNA polymerase specialized sigma24 family protein